MIGSFFYDKGKRESLEKELTDKNDKHQQQLERMWTWKDTHEHDASEKRLRFEVEMAELKGRLTGIKESHDEQFSQLMERFTRIEDKIDRIETRA
jgi:hypothetical protein